MSIYDDLKSLSTNLLTEFDQGGVQLVKITTAVGGTPDDPGTPTETLHDLKATVQGVPSEYVKNGFAVVGDLEVTCALIDGMNVGISDFITIKSIRYKIVRDMITPAAGSAVVWKFIVRRGG